MNTASVEARIERIIEENQKYIKVCREAAAKEYAAGNFPAFRYFDKEAEKIEAHIEAYHNVLMMFVQEEQ